MPVLISQREYARQRKVSVQYINKLVKRGRIALSDGKIDPATADTAIQQTAQRPTQSKLLGHPPAQDIPPLVVAMATPHDSVTLTEAQTRKTLADAERVEIKLERERRHVVAINDVERVVSAHYSSIRALFLGMPTKVAVKLANKSAKEVRAILVIEVRKVLNELTSPLGVIE